MRFFDALIPNFMIRALENAGNMVIIGLNFAKFTKQSKIAKSKFKPIMTMFPAFSSALIMKFGISAAKCEIKIQSKKFVFWSNFDPNRPALNVQMTIEKMFVLNIAI